MTDGKMIELENRIKILEEALSNHASIIVDIGNADWDLEDLEDRLADLKDGIADAETEIDDLESRLTDLDLENLEE